MRIKNIVILVCALILSSVALSAAPQDSTRNQQKGKTIKSHTITITYKTKNDSVIGTETKTIQNNKSFDLGNTYKEYVIENISTDYDYRQAFTENSPENVQVSVTVITQQEAQAKVLMPVLWPMFRDSLDNQSKNEDRSVGERLLSTSEDSFGILPLLLAALALLVSIVATVVLVLLYRRDKKQETERIVNTIIPNPQLTAWRNEVLSGLAARTPQAPAKPNGEIRELQRRISELEDKLRNASSSLADAKASTPPVQQKRLLYADSIVNDLFSGVRENAGSDSIFKLELTSDTRAIVTIYDDAKRKVLANPSYLAGCEKQITGNYEVQTDHNGEAEKDSNGKWRVRTKLKVVLR